MEMVTAFLAWPYHCLVWAYWSYSSNHKILAPNTMKEHHSLNQLTIHTIIISNPYSWSSSFKKLLPQPNDIFLRDPPGPSDLIGRDPFGPEAPVDRLGIDSEMFSQLIDRVIILFHRLPPHSASYTPQKAPQKCQKGPSTRPGASEVLNPS